MPSKNFSGRLRYKFDDGDAITFTDLIVDEDSIRFDAWTTWHGVWAAEIKAARAVRKGDGFETENVLYFDVAGRPIRGAVIKLKILSMTESELELEGAWIEPDIDEPFSGPLLRKC